MNLPAGWQIEVDDEGAATITMKGPKEAAGRALKVEDEVGRLWFGTVDDDGIAMLTRADLLPNRTETGPRRNL
tara:strand:+ start:589 stop:807 length:219 start_codon:yes stop_codon:yes gene_type:complete